MSNRENLLRLYDRLTGLVGKLPGGLQKPILSELLPIRELFLEQRPARIMLLGPDSSPTLPAILADLTGKSVVTGESVSGWRQYSINERGAVELLDARQATPDASVAAALAAAPPDLAIVLALDGASNSPAGVGQAMQRLVSLHDSIPVLGICGKDAQLQGLIDALNADAAVARRNPSAISVDNQPWSEVAESICSRLPNPAKLEFARFTMAKRAQTEIAGTLLKSFTAVCGVIGVQPIPLADLPLLTAIQALMVGLVVYVSGRPAGARLVAEFGGAMGLNVGLGFAFREGARAILKIFPLWGNAISGVVAGAGTYAIGRAAIAYFIEDLPAHEARKLFSALRPKLSRVRPRTLPKWMGGKQTKDADKDAT